VDYFNPDYTDCLLDKNGRWVAEFTAKELDEMLDDLAAAANHAGRPKLRNELDALFDRLEASLDSGR